MTNRLPPQQNTSPAPRRLESLLQHPPDMALSRSELEDFQRQLEAAERRAQKAEEGKQKTEKRAFRAEKKRN
jgi:hypothetical protein